MRVARPTSARSSRGCSLPASPLHPVELCLRYLSASLRRWRPPSAGSSLTLLVLFLLQITGPGASRFGAAFLGRARFSSADASTAAQGGSKPPAAAAATGGDRGGDGQSGKSEQADAGKSVRGGVSYGL